MQLQGNRSVECLYSNRQEIEQGYYAVLYPIDLNYPKRCQLFESVAKHIFYYCCDETSQDATDSDEAFNTIVEFFNNELGFPSLDGGFEIEPDMLRAIRNSYQCTQR